MRVLVANHTAEIVGGAEQYLSAVMPALEQAGISVRLLTETPPCSSGPRSTWVAGTACAQDKIEEWAPDVVFVHGLLAPDLEAWLVDRFPSVLFAHNYYGTCVSGEKRHRFPRSVTCERRFGAPCCGLYWIRGCGPLNPAAFAASLALQRHRALLRPRYRATIVASRYMEAEFRRHNAPGVTRIPLFVAAPPLKDDEVAADGPLVFVGRLVVNKGPELMLRALANLRDRSIRLRVIVLGDGDQRGKLATLALRLGVEAEFRGWVSSSERDEVLRSARLLLLPSIWPEPFGLVGLEAARFGVPAVAFGVGGIPDWLENDVNGICLPPSEISADRFAAAIELALKRLSQGGEMRREARRVAARHTLETHVKELLEVFRGVRS